MGCSTQDAGRVWGQPTRLPPDGLIASCSLSSTVLLHSNPALDRGRLRASRTAEQKSTIVHRPSSVRRSRVTDSLSPLQRRSGTTSLKRWNGNLNTAFERRKEKTKNHGHRRRASPLVYGNVRQLIRDNLEVSKQCCSPLCACHCLLTLDHKELHLLEFELNQPTIEKVYDVSLSAPE